MSVIFDQLRISDDGKSLFLNAHVNKASYFDDLYIKRVTICTEEQVREIEPTLYGSDYIYQQDVEVTQTLEQMYDDVQMLSEKQLLSSANGKGGWQLSYQLKESAQSNYLSLVFSGKFSQFATAYNPKLVVATNAFDPTANGLDYNEILFTVDGERYDDKGHQTWLFKGKGEIKKSQVLNFYLFTQNPEGVFTFVPLEDTDDLNFLHFLWQIYVAQEGTNQREVHLVLSPSMMNENFTKSDFSGNMFFVYVECGGTPAANTPCRLDEMTTLGVTFDYGVLYNQAMNYTRELAQDCQMPTGFIDYILHVDALKIALETEHYVPAIEHWEWLRDSSVINTSYGTKGCGCHG